MGGWGTPSLTNLLPPMGAPPPLGSPRVSPLTLGTGRHTMGGDAANKFWPIFLELVLVHSFYKLLVLYL